jgi:GT2 family glycosyltransferase
MSINIAATVVTFNRLELLKVLINALRNQTTKISKIIVINNSSTDGTEEWLNFQTDLLVIKQKNTGSSGGQFTALKTAYNLGFELIWAMDDDVEPTTTCLENLLYCCNGSDSFFPLRKSLDGNIFLNETKIINLTNPFKSIWSKLIDENDIQKEFIEVDGPTFEGPLISRKMIEIIGLPAQDFFIFADDTEYFIRAKKHGFKNIIVTSAILKRQLTVPEDTKSFTWKHFYVIRNLIAIDVLYGNIWVRFFRPFGYLIKFLSRAGSYENVKTTLKAFLKGYFYQLAVSKFNSD